jgi:hypothetical protein
MHTPKLKRVKKGKPEVIVCIDVSGSTECRYSNNKQLFEEMLEAGWGAHISFKNAGINNSVYAHSTDYGSFAVLYGIVAYNMPLELGTTQEISVGNCVNRFNVIRNVGHNYNADGHALEMVSKQFSKEGNTKIILMLSDGMPSRSKYNSPMQHTKTVVKMLRQQGIVVISMSVVDSVVEDNDAIYDKEWNVRAAGNIEQAMIDVIKNIGMYGV